MYADCKKRHPFLAFRSVIRDNTKYAHMYVCGLQNRHPFLAFRSVIRDKVSSDNMNIWMLKGPFSPGQ